MTDAARRGLGFGLAAAVLLILADSSPRLALATVGVVGLGVALSHADEIASLFNAFTAATGH